MPKRLSAFLVATASYALLLGLAALLLPDPRVLRGDLNPPYGLVPTPGFHVSWFGALLVGAIMALLLSGLRAWVAQRISGTGFNWPTLAGGLLAVLLVLLIANGILWQNTFYIHGALGWAVTPLLVWLGTFVFERFDNRLVGYTQKASNKAQNQISALHKASTSTFSRPEDEFSQPDGEF